MEFNVTDLGQMDYLPCVELQRDVLESVRSGSRGHTLLLVEHPPVLTLGANFHATNLLMPEAEYRRRGIEVIVNDRGGDVTYHGPGQLVIYPIFDLNLIEKDIHKWMRNLEETVIQAIRPLGVEGHRLEVNSGVWVGTNKIAAIGIKVRRWVSMHGMALNCSTDLTPFQWIVPCGIQAHGVTSLSQELGHVVAPDDVKQEVVRSFETVFGMKSRSGS